MSRAAPPAAPLPDPATLARLAADAIPDLLWIVDAQGYCHYFNGTGASFFGARPEELIGSIIVQNPRMIGRFPYRIVELRQEVIEQRQVRSLHHVAIRDAAQEAHYMDVSLHPIEIQVDGQARPCMLGIARRVTELVALEARAGADRGLLDNVARHVPVILWATDRNGLFTLHTGLALKALGLQNNELLGQSAYQLFRRDPQVIRQLDALLAGQPGQWISEFRGLWHESIATPLMGPDGQVSGVIGVSTDVTVRRQTEEKLTRLAYHDPVTGLANRARFMEWLEQHLAAKRPAAAVVHLDIDHFRRINDSFGRPMGDRVLRGVAQRLTALLPQAQYAHLGADHFAALLPGGVAARVQADVERLLASFAEALVLPEGKFYCNASAGVALQSIETDANTWLMQAELAVEQAKREGRNRCRIYDDRMIEGVQDDARLYLELRRALDDGQLEVRYEPRIRLADRAVAGFEALTRWKNPVLSAAPLDQTIRVAQESGLIRDLTREVLRQVGLHLAAWRAAHGEQLPTVSVNIPPAEFTAPGFADQLQATLQAAGAPASALRVELVESTVMQQPDEARAVLKALRTAGIHASLDDFGTGFSSLGALHDLPVDEIKIDRVFLPREMRPSSLSILRTIMALATVLKLHTVIEGVETEAQHQLVLALGCDYAQGYLYSRALDAQAAGELFASGQPV